MQAVDGKNECNKENEDVFKERDECYAWMK